MSDVLSRSQAVAAHLMQRAYRIAIAESCTGGSIAAALTAVSGSSIWFECGFIAYSDAAKVEQLGVKKSTLAKHGAVSAATVAEMASGALQHSSAQLALAVSGIAGPGGGSVEKPVGTVWLARTERDKPTALESVCYHFTGNRLQIREQTVDKALEMLLHA